MRRRLADRLVVFVIAIVLGAVVASPLTVVAGHLFADVPNANPFHDDIDALADSGVTTGCGGPNFCPKDYVTREQMAAFMNRLGALDPTKDPVVNADQVDGLDASAFLSAGDVVMRQLGPWRPWSTNELLFFDELSHTIIYSNSAATKTALIYLAAPVAVGGQAYGLKSVQLCRPGSSGNPTGTITQTRVWETVNASAIALIDDPTDRSLFSTGCYTVTDPTPTASTGGVMVAINIVFPNAMGVQVGAVTATWTPIG